MKHEYFRTSAITIVLLGFFCFAMSLSLEFIFDEHIAGLLAAIATWSLPVFLSTLPIHLKYRRGFLSGSSIGAVMTVIQTASLVVGAKSHVFIPIAAVILMLPAITITVLLERILFTAEERLEIKSRYSRRYQMP
jgi:hypothetical protein